jgi:hypothetical protein
MSIKIHVSLGEALDKLSIIEIKKNKINDHRQDDIVIEFNYLSKELEEYTVKHKYLYAILYKTNMRIWDCMDIIRESKKPIAEIYEYIDETIVLNDSRYLVKKKINEISNSELKEQKGYNLRILNIILNCDLDTITILNGAIRYYSFFYDEVILLSKNENTTYLKQMYSDDKYIKVISIDSSSTSEPKNIRECDNNDCVRVNNSDITVKLSHSFFNKKNIVSDTYDNKYSKEVNVIYKKLGLNVSIFDEYRNTDSKNV